MAHWRRVCAVLSAPDVSINADRLVLNNYFLQNQVAAVQQATRHASNIVSLSLMWSRAWCLARTKITYNSERNYSAEIYRNIFDSWNLFFGISTNGGMCRFFGRFSAPPENLANSACGVNLDLKVRLPWQNLAATNFCSNRQLSFGLWVRQI